MTTAQLWKTHKSQLLLKILMAVHQVHLQYFSLAVNTVLCGYSTLNITLISSPKGSALTRASLRGTALELKKEQAYTHTTTSCYILDYTVLFVVFKIGTMGLSYVFFIVFFASLICLRSVLKDMFCFVLFCYQRPHTVCQHYASPKKSQHPATEKPIFVDIVK